MTGLDAGNTHIYTVRRDGSGFAQLTAEPASDAEPAWQPVQATDVSITPTPSEPTALPAEIGQTIDVGQASALMYADGSLWVDVLTRRRDEHRHGPADRPRLWRDPGAARRRGLSRFRTRWERDGLRRPVSLDRGDPVVDDGATGGILVRIDPDTDTAETIDLPVGVTDINLVFDDGFRHCCVGQSRGEVDRSARGDVR
jgi:hypothetical protein